MEEHKTLIPKNKAYDIHFICAYKLGNTDNNIDRGN